MNAGIDYTFMVTNGLESINVALGLSSAYTEEWVKALNSDLYLLGTQHVDGGTKNR